MRSRDLVVVGMLTLLMLMSNMVPSGAETPDDEPVGAHSGTDAYYHFRYDSGLCLTPPCGGFVKLVNHITTPCAGDEQTAECRVAYLDYSELFLSDAEHDRLLQAAQAGRVLLKGRIEYRDMPVFTNMRHFVVSEAWIAAGDNPAIGTFYRVTNIGMNCLLPPCPAYREAELNGTRRRIIDEVVLTPAGASEQQIEKAYHDMAYSDGVLVTGVHRSGVDRYGKTKVLVGSQFYMRMLPSRCQPTGCSGQICAVSDVITTCEWRPEYACFRTAMCEWQLDGQCGWTETPELLACLDRAMGR